jgi:MCP family monocarboxylic acid transporter-like MFS transporter 10
VSNGVSVLGRVLPNMLVAHVGIFNMMITCVGICSLLVFCMSAVKDAPGIIVFAVLNGFFSGACA